MKIVLLALAFSLFASHAFTQVLQERKHITGGSALWENFAKEMFLYPSFMDGVVEYRNGQKFPRKLNYNRILKTIQFIDEKGDTLALANENAVGRVVIAEDEFIYHPQCLQVVYLNKDIRIFKHEELRIADIRRKGAYGVPNSSSAIESLNQVYTWMNSYQLDINELLLLSKTTTFYVLTEKDKLLPATRKNVLNAFDNKSDKVKEYVDKKDFRFNSEADLAALGKYLASLN